MQLDRDMRSVIVQYRKYSVYSVNICSSDKYSLSSCQTGRVIGGHTVNRMTNLLLLIGMPPLRRYCVI